MRGRFDKRGYYILVYFVNVGTKMVTKVREIASSFILKIKKKRLKQIVLHESTA